MVVGPVPFAYEHRPGLDSLPIRKWQTGRLLQLLVGEYPIQEPDRSRIEITEGVSLDPVGEHSEEKLPSKVQGRTATGR